MKSDPPKDLRELYASGGPEAVRRLAEGAEDFVTPASAADRTWLKHEDVNGRPERRVDWPAYFEAGRIDLSRTRGMDADDIRDTMPDPVIDGILRQGSVALLAGASKARKSWLALHLAICAATGRPFLGFPTRASSIKYLDFELKERTAAARYALARLGVSSDPEIQARIDETIAFYSMRSMPAEDGTLRGIASWIEATGQPGELWFLDCLQPVLEVDANDAVEVRGQFRPLLLAAEKSGATLVIIDHFNKNSEARGMARVSGSVAKVAAVDAIITLSPRDEDVITVDFDLREDPPVSGETLIRFNSSTHGFDLVTPEDAAAAAEKRDRETALGYIADGWNDYSVPKTREELSQAWSLKTLSAVSKRLDALKGAGLIVEGEPRGKAKTYQPASVSKDQRHLETGGDR